MEISVKGSMLVKPIEETPTRRLWLSTLDLFFPTKYHTRVVYFYRSDGSPRFFDAAAVKAALSRALVEFYPYAGRLGEDDNGRIEINCNGEGVGFAEAECDATLDDLGGFGPRDDIRLTPTVDYSQGISSFPLFLVQLTRFKCGGVCLGFANHHQVADGSFFLLFINSWAAIARGLGAVPLFFDRRVLSAPNNPPRPRFPHIEHQPAPLLKTPLPGSDETAFSIFKLSRDQINALRKQCRGGKYSLFQVVTGHVWRCVTMARGLPKDQETKLRFSTDGRRRLRPPLPQGYFGNVIFYSAALALCGELESNPLAFAVGKVKEAVERMDDEYLRSALDNLELLRRDTSGINIINNVSCPNFGMTDWVGLPFFEADFGWGKPVHCGPGAAPAEGRTHMFIDPQNEGCIMLGITLHKRHMIRFEKFLYDCIISKI